VNVPKITLRHEWREREACVTYGRPLACRREARSRSGWRAHAGCSGGASWAAWMSVMESQMRIALPYRDTPYYQFPKGALVMGVRRSQSSQC
jgi:hypothetical protein